MKLTVAGRVQPGGTTTELALPDASLSLVLASGPGSVVPPELLSPLLAAVEEFAAPLDPPPALELAPVAGNVPLPSDELPVEPPADEPAALDAAAPFPPLLSPPADAELAPANPPLLLAAVV